MKRYPPRKTSLYDQSKEALRPVVGVDIDGTIGFYHEHFWSFACAWTGRQLPHPGDYKGGSFASFLGLSKATYRKIKLAYRRGGLKRSMPVRPGASDLTAALRDRGALVILCTTRPYLSLENIDEDTRHWTKRSKISHDAIIWGEHKYRELARYGSRVVGVLEDEPLLLRGAMDLGLTTVRMNRSYNEDAEADFHAGDCKEARMIMLDLMYRWENENR